ncbi:hypothetical protein AK34_3268 [Burkholderia dolosa AU0158]|nr:hypothetical protein AK34_3268 [Burkholderia dolosa AU0158]VWB34142.1 hypothetical protein BDO18943_01471 [Burkholderia dolosa]
MFCCAGIFKRDSSWSSESRPGIVVTVSRLLHKSTRRSRVSTDDLLRTLRAVQSTAKFYQVNGINLDEDAISAVSRNITSVRGVLEDQNSAMFEIKDALLDKIEKEIQSLKQIQSLKPFQIPRASVKQHMPPSRRGNDAPTASAPAGVRDKPILVIPRPTLNEHTTQPNFRKNDVEAIRASRLPADEAVDQRDAQTFRLTAPGVYDAILSGSSTRAADQEVRR